MKELLRESWSSVMTRYGTFAGLAMVALSFFIPIWPRVLPILTILFLVSLLLRYRPWRIPHRMYFVRSPALTLSALFYICYLIGLIWTSNFGYAVKDLEIKLSLLVFPLVFFMIPVRLVSMKQFSLFFVKGCFYAVLLCFFLATFRVSIGDFSGPWHLQYTFSAFSVLVHPSYFAMYLCTALAFWYLQRMDRSVEPFARIVVPVFLCIGVILAGSKSGWAILLLELPVLIIFFRKEKTVLRVLGGFLIFTLVSGALLYGASDYVSSRVNEMVTVVLDGSDEVDPETSTAVRSAIWSVGKQLWLEAPILGQGTGDVKDALNERFRISGMNSASAKHLNAHSQYLQTGLTLGLMGAVIFALLILIPLQFAWRNRNYSMIAFLLINAVNWSVESMLEVQAGVLFFAWGVFVLSLKTEK